MGVQNVLQLTGIDVVTRGDDHPLGSALEINEALLVHGAQIAGIDPGQPIGVGLEGMGGLLRVLHVFLHHSGPGQKDFTFLAVGQLLIRSRCYDLDVGIGERQADAALFCHMGRSQAAGGHRFGGAVAFPHLNGGLVVIEELVELFLQFHRQGVSAREHALQTAEISAIHRGQAQQRLVQGGNTGNEIAAMLDDQLGIAFGGKAGHQNAPPALGQHGMDADTQTETVEQGHGGQHFVAGTEHLVGGNDLLAESVEIAVGEHDALGGAGGAARIQDHGRIVGLAVHAVMVEAMLAQLHKLRPADHRSILWDLFDLSALGEHITRLDGLGESILDGSNHQIDYLGVVPNPLKLVIKLIQRDGGDAFRFIEVEFDLLFCRQRMDHIGNAAHQIDGVEQVNGLRAVGQRNGDPVALTDADGFQRLGAGLDLRDHLPVGGGFSHKIEGNLVGILLCYLLHHFKHGALKVIQMHGHVTHRILPRRFCGDMVHISNLPPDPAAAPAVQGFPASASAASRIWNSNSRLPAAHQWSVQDQRTRTPAYALPHHKWVAF